jgi:hypothetical protein
MLVYVLLLVMSCIREAEPFFRGRLVRIPGVNLRSKGMLDSIDISPVGVGGIMKRVIRAGNPSKIPGNKDDVEISWKIWLEDGTLASSSADVLEDGEPFSFKLGADPREVIRGWEASIRTMREGEIAQLIIEPEFAFGAAGAEPMIPANATITCELCLERLVPSLSRSYQSVGMNESIKDELIEKIQSRQSPIAEEAIANRVVNETKSEEEIRYFDPAKHKVDPRLLVMGEGQGYAWEENAMSIDVEVPLLDGVGKKDLEVDIKTRSIRVALSSSQGEGQQQLLLHGPLHGTVATSESGWVVVEADPTARSRLRGRKLVVSLAKTYASQEIWTTLFDKNFIMQQQGLENQ